MELTNLYHFKAVAECGSVKKAAEKLYITPPALSQSIRKLERELGEELFLRSSNRMILNDTGRKYLESVCGILHMLDDANREVMGFSKKNAASKRIIIGASSSAAIHYLRLARPTYTDIYFQTRLIGHDMLEKALANDDVDIALTIEPFDDPHLVCSPLFQEQMMLSVPSGHPFYDRKDISIHDLHQKNLVRMLCFKEAVEKRFAGLEKKHRIHINFIDVDCIEYWDLLEIPDYLFLCSDISESAFSDYDRRNIPFTDRELNLTHYICLPAKTHIKNIETADLLEIITWSLSRQFDHKKTLSNL